MQSNLCVLISLLALLLGCRTSAVAQQARAALPTGAVEVQVTDASGQGLQSLKLYSSSHALVIGIDKYVSWDRLNNAENDAVAVAAALRRHGFLVTPKLNLKYDDLAREIRHFLLTAGSDPDARLLIWFAGHGHTVKREQGNRGYIVAADAPKPGSDTAPNPEFLSKALSMAQIVDWMDESSARHVLAIFDSCFSGTVLTTRSSSELNVPPSIRFETAGKSRQVITSGDADQKVLDDGTFRRLFIEGISGETAGVGIRGYVTGIEIGKTLQARISELTRNGRVQQRPTFSYINRPGIDKGDFVFEVIRPDGTRMTPLPPTGSVQQPTNSDGKPVFTANAACVREWEPLKPARADKCKELKSFLERCSGTREGERAEDRISMFCGVRSVDTQPTSGIGTATPAAKGIFRRTLEAANKWWSTPAEPPKPTEPEKPKLPPIDPEEGADWKIANAVNTAKAYEQFIKKWPDSRHLDEAKASLQLQQRKSYSLSDVEKAAQHTSEAIRSNKLTYETYDLDLERIKALNESDEDLPKCNWDTKTRSTFRGFALSRMYFRGFLSFLRYGELSQDNWQETANTDSTTPVTSNARVLMTQTREATLLDLIRKVRGQRFPFTSNEAQHIKALAHELLQRKPAFDAISDVAFRKWELSDTSYPDLPTHANPCFRLHVAFKRIGLRLGKSEGKDVIAGIGTVERLDSWLDDFWIARRREGSSGIAEVILRYIRDN